MLVAVLLSGTTTARDTKQPANTESVQTDTTPAAHSTTAPSQKRFHLTETKPAEPSHASDATTQSTTAIAAAEQAERHVLAERLDKLRRVLDREPDQTAAAPLRQRATQLYYSMTAAEPTADVRRELENLEQAQGNLHKAAISSVVTKSGDRLHGTSTDTAREGRDWTRGTAACAIGISFVMSAAALVVAVIAMMTRKRSMERVLKEAGLK